MIAQPLQTPDHAQFHAAVTTARERFALCELLPAYSGGEPMKLLRRTTFADYLEEIRPRLEALQAAESKPKVIPRIFEFWKEPEAFQGMLG
jgi:hypothetical protein